MEGGGEGQFGMKESSAAAAATGGTGPDTPNQPAVSRQPPSPPRLVGRVHHWGACGRHARSRAVGVAAWDNSSARWPRAPLPPIAGPACIVVVWWAVD
ncbi:hypothetical protein T492DRAFT_870743 [Pavlovales sp. CCMP2436]|nr:hypothetical protein T492DRAFT_870743 [Pavlovales sp. CCMP2436]